MVPFTMNSGIFGPTLSYKMCYYKLNVKTIHSSFPSHYDVQYQDIQIVSKMIYILDFVAHLFVHRYYIYRA